MEQTPFIQSDVQSETDQMLTAVSWVGMGQIQSSLNIGEFNVPCSLDIGVNLKAGYRGIHMSRLYQAHQQQFLHQQLNLNQFRQFLTQSLQSQAELSDEISMKVQLQFPMKTKSLQSDLEGYRNYPLQIIVEKNRQNESAFLQFEVLYSSTCPQSASLSVEVLRESSSLPERLPATPHAQRSRAIIKVQVQDFSNESIENLIKLVEQTLKTPVQTAVKKADEMQFARLNAQNLMFCEDAARKIALKLKESKQTTGFSVYCEHQESLHPHNAVGLILHNFNAPKHLIFT